MSFKPENIKDRLREQPFKPLRLVTSTAQTYDIYHPDMVMVGLRFLLIGTPSDDNPAFPDLFTRVALMHVTELRDLPTLVAPSGDS